MNMDNLKIPKELETAIKENNLVLFIGAGLSYNFINKNGKKLEGWNNLVKEILDNVEGLDHLKPFVGKHEPIEILNSIEGTGKGAVLAFVKEFFTIPPDKNNYSLHKKLCKLSNKIITTNYDNAFENADPDFNTKTVFMGNTFELNILHNHFEKTLFKLHGSITAGNSMILFPSDYDKLYERKGEDAEKIIFNLQNLIFNKTILFIGSGMGDFQINNIFLDIKRILGKYDTKKHYIIAKEPRLDSKLKDFLELIPVDDFPEIEIIIDEFLKIKDKKNEDKIKLEKQLAEVKERIEKENKENNRINSLSLKYEKEGLEYLLDGNYERSVEKFLVSTEFNENNNSAFCYWGTAIFELARMKQDENLYEQAIEKYEKTCKINYRYFTLSCFFASLEKKEKALHYLEESLRNKQIEVNLVLDDDDWKNYLNDNDFIFLINKYK
jgi:tetratricopeptide (TPR) repeat protein